MTIEEAVEVRDLRQHADRAEYRERRRIDPGSDARHQVAATGGDLVHAHDQRNVALPDPR